MKKLALSALIALALLGATFVTNNRAHAASTFSPDLGSPGILIASQARLLNDGSNQGELDVTVTYICPTTTSTPASLTVTATETAAADGTTATGTGSVPLINCDGAAHNVAVDVATTTYPPFNVGAATATATILDSTGATVVATPAAVPIRIAA